MIQFFSLEVSHMRFLAFYNDAGIFSLPILPYLVFCNNSKILY